MGSLQRSTWAMLVMIWASLAGLAYISGMTQAERVGDARVLYVWMAAPAAGWLLLCGLWFVVAATDPKLRRGRAPAAGHAPAKRRALEARWNPRYLPARRR